MDEIENVCNVKLFLALFPPKVLTSSRKPLIGNFKVEYILNVKKIILKKKKNKLKKIYEITLKTHR